MHPDEVSIYKKDDSVYQQSMESPSKSIEENVFRKARHDPFENEIGRN
jgi:hypothetical protein